MSIEFINPPSAPPSAGGYRQLAIIPSNRRLLVLAGQIGNTMDGTIVDGLEQQYEQALANIVAIVESEGGTSSDVARITVFLTEKPEGSRKIGEANDKYFPNGQPAMSWIYVAGLFRPDVKVEIEAIAAVD